MRLDGTVPFEGAPMDNAGFSLLLASAFSSVASGGPPSSADFLTKARPAWEAYCAKAAHLQGKISTKAIGPGSKVEYENSVQIKQAPQCGLVIVSPWPDGSHGRDHVYAVNSRYRFELRRKKSTALWAISLLSEERITPRREGRPDVSTLAMVNSWVKAPVTTNGLDSYWPTITADPGFVVLRAAPRAVGNRMLFEVQFEMPPSQSPSYSLRLMSGRVVFDPDHLWVMQSADVNIESAGPRRKPNRRAIGTVYDYAYEADGFPILKKYVETENVVGKGKYVTEQEYSLSFGDIPESEFTLSAFGFPEPNWTTNTGTRWFLWAAIGGIGCIGIAFLLRHWLRTRSLS